MASANAPVDYYALLGLPRDAQFRQISAAYWRLAAERRDQLPLLNAAYEKLTQPQRRPAHDAQRDEASQRPEATDQRAALERKPGVREKLNWPQR